MKNKIISPLSILIAGSIVLRLIVYLFLPVGDAGKSVSVSSLYLYALTDHFGDYLSFTTNIPPGTFFIHAFILSVAGVKTAVNIHAFLILVFLLDTIAVALLFRSAIRLGSSARLSFFMMVLLSLALVPFELWRDGMHYDHLTFFFTSFFAWAIVKLIKNENSIVNMLLVSLTCALLVSQSAANSAIAPVSIFSILCIVFLFRKKIVQFGYALLITLFLPVLVLVMISKKNQSEGQESLTSNKAGPAMMMVVQRAYNYDVQKIRAFAKSNHAPDWYTWAYDHATAPVDSVNGKPAEGWINLAQAFGICFFSADGKIKTNSWGFDFNPLIQYLQANNNTPQLAVAKADAYDAIYRPYRFAGFSPELSPRWIGMYGDVSKKLFFESIKQNPVGMAKAFVEQQGIFLLYGPLFTYNTTQKKPSLLARSGLRTVEERLPLDFLFIPATLIFALALLITYIIVLINIPVNTLRVMKNLRSRKKDANINHFILLSIPVLCVAGVYSCLVGGENDRYFIQAAPYLVILTTCLPALFSGRRKHI